VIAANRLRVAALVGSTLCALVAATSAQDRPRADAPPDINKPFEAPDLDAQKFVERFESESREVYAHRQAIAATLDLKPGQEVADIGAGTGLFTFLFAEQVKPDGKVFAVDIAPSFLELIARRAREMDLGEVVATVRGAQDGTNLERRSIDVAFLCDTYHHFEEPDRMLRSIRRALRPGGRLVLVEFDREKAGTDFVKTHVRADRETFLREIADAGFEPIELEAAPELSENFIAAFRKVAAPQPRTLRKAPVGAGAPRGEARP